MDSLGDRIKGYEMAARGILPRRLPIIIRCDGRAFHTYTKHCVKPFDSDLSHTMVQTTNRLCNEIHGAQLAYTQSDEISILVHNYKKYVTEPWLGNQIQKMVSIAAGIASSEFTARAPGRIKPAVFDARVFVLPESEVCNYFIWRQQDATRNSIQMLARSLYSHKECHKKNTKDLQEMCFQKGKNWNDLEVRWKRGVCVVRPPELPEVNRKWTNDLDIPIFTADRNYIEKYLVVEDES